jgi:hypothetical protein
MNKIDLIWHYVNEFKNNSSYLEEYYFYYTWNTLKKEVRFRISAKGWDYINSKVHEAIHIYHIEDFCKEDLTNPIWNGMSNPNRYYRKYHFLNNWYKQIAGKHRQPTHYIKKDHHKRKELTEHSIAKAEWRENKGFIKDKKRNGWKRRNAGKYYKKFSNRMHRRWQKEKIFNQEFDEIGDNLYHFFQNPWMWD